MISRATPAVERFSRSPARARLTGFDMLSAFSALTQRQY